MLKKFDVEISEPEFVKTYWMQNVYKKRLESIHEKLNAQEPIKILHPSYEHY